MVGRLGQLVSCGVGSRVCRAHPQLLNKGSEPFSYPCTPTTMLPRSAYWHHITGSQNMAESSSYAGECPQGPAGIPQPLSHPHAVLCLQVSPMRAPRPARTPTSSTGSSC